MKKVYVLKVTQNNITSYVGAISARELVRLATTKELNEPQEAQRPIEPKRLEEISQFVMNDGIIATSIVIGTIEEDKLFVHETENPSIPGLCYIEFPETEEEFELYKDSFDIMDGQHRLFAFLKDRIKIDDTVNYELTFNMYVRPTVTERRLIFKNTNEKQKQVASNLLLWFRKQLNMLSVREEKYHSIVEALNTEAISPLKGRIIMGAERITGGFKAEQIINILTKAEIKDIGGGIENDKVVKLVSEYLCGWEDAVGCKISERKKEYAPFSKISGFRFMMLMLPAFYEKAVTDKRPINREEIANAIRELFAAEGYVPSDIFDTDGELIKELGLNPFAGETPTTCLAKEWSNKLRNQSTQRFDPLA